MADGEPAALVFCVRHQTEKTVEEHLDCPYCHAQRRADVGGGERTAFCDYDPERDPLAFGFPEGTSRQGG